MLLNKPRAYEVMDKYGLDGLIAVNQINIYYLTDYWGPLMRMRRMFFNYGLLPRKEDAPAALVETAVGLLRLFENRSMTWVPNVCGYTHPIYSDRRDFDPDVEEPEAVQEGIKWPVTEGPLSDTDEDYLKFAEEFKGSYAVNPLYALKKAIVDAGLEKATVGIDDPRVIDWLHEVGLPDIKGVEATTIFREIRMVKSPDELNILRQAAAMNEDSVNAAIGSLHVGMDQDELEIVYNTELARRGGKGVYLSTGSMGRRKDNVKENQLITFDGLCEFKHYHGDMGRTAICGEPTDEMLKRNQIMRKGCEIAYDMIKPGVKGREMTTRVIEEMRKMGFPGFFICTPHSVGLEHTDHPLPIGPMLPGSQGEFVFQENMVFTIDMPYYEVGWGNMHLEDTVRVSADGCDPFNSCDVGLRIVPPGGGEVVIAGA